MKYFVATLLLFLSTNIWAKIDELNIHRKQFNVLSGRKKCTAVLRYTKAEKPIKHLLVVANDIGRYSVEMDDEMPPPPVWLLMRNEVGVLSVNKPGVSLSKDKELSINENIFRNNSIQDLVNCIERAIDYQLTNQNSKVAINKIMLLGHGEGVSVAVRVFKQLIEKKPKIAQKVLTLYLAGSSFNNLFDYEIKNLIGEEKWPKYTELFEKKDVDGLYNFFEQTLSYNWLVDIKANQNLGTYFDYFASRGVKSYINVYTGLNDFTIDFESVKKYEAANLAKLEQKKPSLNMFYKYYNSENGLNTSASNDIFTSMFWDILVNSK